MNPNADYWNQGINNVPAMTGAATLMDGADIKEHAERLGFSLPLGLVLDVGCGTGRLAPFCLKYEGVDIAADAVAYAQAQGVHAHLISGPVDLPHAQKYGVDPGCELVYSWVLCLSVFTHIDRAERLAYLQAFADRVDVEDGRLLVDIIPGSGDGDVALWSADPAQFEADLAAAGWHVVATYDRVCPSGPTHRYYRCARTA